MGYIVLRIHHLSSDLCYLKPDTRHLKPMKSRAGLRAGHTLAGTEARPTRNHEVQGCGVRVACHTFMSFSIN